MDQHPERCPHGIIVWNLKAPFFFFHTCPWDAPGLASLGSGPDTHSSHGAGRGSRALAQIRERFKQGRLYLGGSYISMREEPVKLRYLSTVKPSGHSHISRTISTYT